MNCLLYGLTAEFLIALFADIAPKMVQVLPIMAVSVICINVSLQQFTVECTSSLLVTAFYVSLLPPNK
jgi:hypothetical protein